MNGDYDATENINIKTGDREPEVVEVSLDDLPEDFDGCCWKDCGATTETLHPIEVSTTHSGVLCPEHQETFEEMQANQPFVPATVLDMDRCWEGRWRQGAKPWERRLNR